MMNAPEALILESAQRLFSRQSPVELAHARGSVDTLGLWSAIDASGLDRIMVPVDFGGFGADLLDAVGTVRAAGYCAAHAPIVEGIAARWALAAAGFADAEGPVVLGEWHDAGSDGHAGVMVPWGRFAKLACVLEVNGDDTLLHAFRVDPVKLSRRENLAGEPRDVLTLDASVGRETRTSPLRAERVRGLCALLRAAQMSGAMDRVLDITVEHAKTREQFGKPIGQFQAVQQLLARMACEVAAATAAVDAGALQMRRDDSWLGGALAKSRTSEAVAIVNAVAHQVVAAMGFTREFPLQLFTRRLWAWRDEYGTEHEWNERIGDTVLRAGADRLWDFLVEPRLEAA